jgi:hypothetical protein
MNLKRIVSALSAAAMTLSCAYIPTVNALSAVYAEEEGEDIIYIPDFPQEVLAEFDIDWTGLGSNRFVENTEYDADKNHNKLQYDGGYAMFSYQAYVTYFCYGANWHDCDNFTMYQSKDFSMPEYADKLDLKMDMYLNCNIKKEGELKFGPLLELNSGKDELFIVEKRTESTDFSACEKIGSYVSDDMVYELYKEAKEDAEAPVRYYAVNVTGIVKEGTEEQFYGDLISNISDHLAKLHELTGAGTRLDKYGMLNEGKKGRGYSFTNSCLTGSYLTLPEEELTLDENHEPITYDHSFVKNIDGWRYSFQNFNACWPIDQLEDGRYVNPSHENNSKMTPLGDGKFHAEVSEWVTSCASVGKEFDGKASVLDKNYNLSCKYKSSKSISPAASVYMLDPYVRVEFQEKSCASELEMFEYQGNIELDGEEYEVYRHSHPDYDIQPLLEEGFKSYYIVHVDEETDKEESETKEFSYPICALIDAAKPYGLEAGKLARVSVVCNSFSGDYNVDILETSLTEAEPTEKGSIYTDVKKHRDVCIAPYYFNAITQGYMRGYENGLFKAESKDTYYSEFSAGKRIPDREKFVLDSCNNVKAEYKVENTFEDKYEIGYSVSATTVWKNVGIRIIEKCKNFPIEYNYSKSEFDNNGFDFSPSNSTSGYGWGEYITTETADGHKRELYEYVTTYSAGGHEYDLYSYKHEYHGCFGINYFEEYVSIRKDQDDGDILEGSVDLSEHISGINAGFSGRLSILRVNLIAESLFVNGSVKALKNDINFEKIEVPDVIIGDFNKDSSVNSLDVVTARKLLISQLTLENTSDFERMDVNQSGAFDIADVLLLQSFVIGKIKAFPQAEK